MADIFYDTTGSFSALTPYKIVAGNYNTKTSNNSIVALNTARTQAFTASEAGDCTGALVPIRIITITAAQSVTLTLQEDDGGWQDRASKTINYDDIVGTHKADMDNAGMCWTFFEFASAYTITTDAATWRIKIESTDANASLWLSNDGGYPYAIPLDTTTSYSASDNIIQAQETIITIDQTITADWWVQGTNSEIVWENPPAASYTLTIATIQPSANAAFRCGDANNKIPYSEKATVEITNVPRTSFEWMGQFGGEFEIYGAHQNDYYAEVASDAASGQADIVTVEDRSGEWANGDSLRIWSDSGIGTYTVDSVSGTTVTLTTNLSVKVTAGWKILNFTRADETFGVEWIGYLGTGSGNSTTGGGTQSSVMELSGIFNDTTKFYLWNYVYGNSDAPGNAEAFTIEHIVTESSPQQIYVNLNTSDTPESYEGSTFQYLWKTANSQNILLSANRSTFTYINAGIYVTTLQLDGNENTYTDICAYESYTGATRTTIYHSGANNTWTNVKVGQAKFYLISSFNSTFTNVDVDNSDGVGIFLDGSLGNKFIDCEFGQNIGNTGGSVGMGIGYNQAVFQNCLFDSTLVDTTVPDAVSGSHVKVHDADQTTDDHRGWYKYGKTQSTKAGLPDTTVHTAGGMAIRFEPTDSANNLDWEFTIPTGDIQNKEMMVGIWCKINNANFYSGTHQMPRITVDYDNGTTAYSEAAETTDWQFLPLPFTPTTTYGQITVTLSARTDQATTDAYVYWDDFSTLFPANSPLNTQNFDLWANALPVTPPIATVLSAQDIWAVATSTLTGAGTIGKYLTDGTLPDEVWDEATADHVSSGSFGEKVGKKLLSTAKFLGLR